MFKKFWVVVGGWVVCKPILVFSLVSSWTITFFRRSWSLLYAILSWRFSEFLKVRILGSRIPDIIQEKSGHLWNINIRMIKLSEMYNNLALIFCQQLLFKIETEIERNFNSDIFCSKLGFQTFFINFVLKLPPSVTNVLSSPVLHSWNVKLSCSDRLLFLFPFYYTSDKK